MFKIKTLYIMSKIEKMKRFHKWLYETVKSIHVMSSEEFENIIEKI